MHKISWRISLERRLLPGGVQHLLRSDIGVSETPPCTLNTGTPGTPTEVASRFAIMIEEGILGAAPAKLAHKRNKLRRPGGLERSLYYGYIHPNLPPPPGLEWKSTAFKTMQLVARGG